MIKAKYSINVIFLTAFLTIFLTIFLFLAGFVFLNNLPALAGDFDFDSNSGLCSAKNAASATSEAIVKSSFIETENKIEKYSGAAASVNNLKFISLIDNNSDICFQLLLTNGQKKMLSALSKRIIDDRFFIESAAGLKELFENSIIRFFLKTAFESLLKDLLAVSFSHSVIEDHDKGKGISKGKNDTAEYVSSLIFTFSGPDISAQIYETRADLFEMLYCNGQSSIEVKIIEEEKDGAKTAYALIDGKAASLAIFIMKDHIAFLYSPRCRPKDFSQMSEITAASIKKYDFSAKSDRFNYDNNLKDFKKDNNFVLSADLTNLAIEDTAAAELIKSVFIGAKLEDDYSTISFDSYIEFCDAGRSIFSDSKGSFAAKASSGAERKTLNALKLLFKPLKNASSAMDYLPAEAVFLTEFNLNFNDEFLAITDVFVFRGLLLTAAGIDYKDDFLSWFDGGLFIGAGKLNIGAEALINKKPVKMPEIYIGFKLKTPDLKDNNGDKPEVSPADKLAGKIIELISDNFSPVKAELISAGPLQARRVEVPASPYFTTGEIVFGNAGGYYLITSSKAAFEKIARAADKKPGSAVKKLSEVIDSKKLALPATGRFFNLYINYRSLRAVLDKFIEFYPSLKAAAVLPIDYYLSAAMMADNGDIKSGALIAVDKDLFYSILNKINISGVIEYLGVIDDLAKRD